MIQKYVLFDIHFIICFKWYYIHIQELDCGALQISCLTQVLSEHQQMETLESSTVILQHSVPTWGSGSPHRDWILQGISPTLSSFNSTTALAIPVTIPFGYKTHHYSLLSPLTMVFTLALSQMTKELCKLYTSASTPMHTWVIYLLCQNNILISINTEKL